MTMTILMRELHYGSASDDHREINKSRAMKDHHPHDSHRPEKRGRIALHRIFALTRGSLSQLKAACQHRHHHHHHSGGLGVVSDARRRTALLALLAVLATAQVLRSPFGLTSQAPPSAAAPEDASHQQGDRHWWTDAEAERNARQLEWRRDSIRAQCRSRGGTSPEANLWREQLNRASAAAAALTGTSAGEAGSTSTGTASPRACRLAFFDLGANVGDSLGKFISVGIPSCSDDDGDAQNRTGTGLRASNSGATGAAGAGPAGDLFSSHTHATNRLVRWAAQQIAEVGQTLEGTVLRPEHYCYFGVEGNPVFTDRLRSLQDGILRTQPRPVRWAQFFTETVASAVDGPTVLYLDTKNEARNYWGSSLLHSHKDVQASANQDGQVYQAQVRGVTLTTLLRDHVVAEHGSHVLIKMDVEGSEYGLLNEARDSGILCELTERAIRVDLLVEVHSKKVVGPLDDMERFRKEVKRDLEHWCGINLQLTMEVD